MTGPLTIEQVADLLGIPAHRAVEMRAAGTLPQPDTGGRWSAEAVSAWAERGGTHVTDGTRVRVDGVSAPYRCIDGITGDTVVCIAADTSKGTMVWIMDEGVADDMFGPCDVTPPAARRAAGTRQRRWLLRIGRRRR